MQILDNGIYTEVSQLHIPTDLEYYKVWKKNQINDSYYSTVKSGFKSSTSGEELLYGYSDFDQMKWMKLFISVSNGIVQYPVTISAKDDTILRLDEAQIKQLLIDINIWEWVNQERLHECWSDIDACESIEDASLINF